MQEWSCLLAMTITVRAWVVFVFKLTYWELLNKLILPCTESHVARSQPGCSDRRTHRANSGYKVVPKLRWPKARNAVKYYWGIPGEQVSPALAFSSGSHAETYQSLLHAARHTCTVPPPASHRAPSHPRCRYTARSPSQHTEG